jgi:hypothetical protein
MIPLRSRPVMVGILMLNPLRFLMTDRLNVGSLLLLLLEQYDRDPFRFF